MDAIQAISSRHSVRAFLPKPVPRETLEGLIDLVRLYSSSGANKNTWRFVAITKKDSLVSLSGASIACKWLSSAPAGIAIVISPASTRYWLEGCSVAAYLIWLAATAQGLGCSWAAMYQSDNAEETKRRQQLVSETLGIPEDMVVPMVLSVGYPDSQPAGKARPERTGLISWDRYSETYEQAK